MPGHHDRADALEGNVRFECPSATRRFESVSRPLVGAQAAIALCFALGVSCAHAPILPRGSGLLICVMVASLGIACAAFAERRSFALVSILVVFAVPLAVAEIVIDISDGDAAAGHSLKPASDRY